MSSILQNVTAPDCSVPESSALPTTLPDADFQSPTLDPPAPAVESDHTPGQPATPAQDPIDDDLINPEPLPDHHALSDCQPPQRPGILNYTLHANGITITNPGPGQTWGLKIPHFGFEAGEGGRYPIDNGGRQYCRERLAYPKGGHKYSQPAGTSPKAYFPLNLAALLAEKRYLIIVEGEFKAISLVEGGYPAIGIAGFYGFHLNRELLPELFAVWDWMNSEGGGCESIYFLGDADTAINAQFADAAIQFRDALVSANVHTEVRLPRMPLADMETQKGIDDARASNPDLFATYLEQILQGAVLVDGEMSADVLAKVLFERESAEVRKLCSSCPGDKRAKLLKKLARLAGAMGAIGCNDVGDICVQTGLINNSKRFADLVHQERKSLRAEMEQKQPKRLVEIHYCPDGGKNYIYRAGGSYTRVDRQGVINHLVESGYSNTGGGKGALSEAAAILTSTDQRPVSWCRPLAGKAAGIHDMNGKRVLVTESPALLTPRPGLWPTIDQYLSGAFDYDPHSDPAVEKKAQRTKQQRLVVLAWLRQAVRSLYGGGNFTPAPALVLCGRRRGGKSTFQRLVTELLGGRQANPFAFMNGRTSHNGELAGAEHWAIDDDQESSRYSDREVMKSEIKKACVVSKTSYNGKHRESENLESWRRLTISLNDDEASLRVLPELSENFSDKIVLVHFINVAGLGAATFDSWWLMIKQELPAFLHYLLKEHEVTGADQAYGLLPYHDPEIVGLISGQSRDAEVGRLIDHYVMAFQTGAFEGTAHELFDSFEPRGRDQLKQIGCGGARIMGRCLAKLTQEMPARYQVLPLLNGITRYRVQPVGHSANPHSAVILMASGPAAGLTMPAAAPTPVSPLE